MKWNKYTLTTTTEAEDLISSMMMDAGIEGIEIEDKIPMTQIGRASCRELRRSAFIWSRIRTM